MIMTSRKTDAFPKEEGELYSLTIKLRVLCFEIQQPFDQVV